MIAIDCKICHKSFWVHNYRINAMFCSNPCRGRWLKENNVKPPPRTNAIPWNKGKNRMQDKRIEAIALSRTGEKNWMWRGGRQSYWEKIKKSPEYKLWRKSVFERDKYTCVHCGTTNTYIEADHIKPKSTYPELMYDINNGRTLCKPCHKRTPTYGVKALWKR